MGTRKRNKYNLDLDDDEDEKNFDMNFLTHKGKRLEDLDDFKDKIAEDSDDYEDKDLARGTMNDEMVNALNFGGGEQAPTEKGQEKKTREERLAEIMEKSKAYKRYN